ncbi:glycosyltransferase family 2 protein [uncultured Roseobacter sp.]|uniref:glycosyltransferase family 2 protein n=1 Tax=uncultured Roseobacter sp. TaxID=114847 RepID=UPI002629924C|nr:glycosyltransferase family 2 protein [uncultured Roseobacter sp.]
MTSFSVLVLMKESAAVIHRFAAYYSRIGAAQTVIFIDGPIGPELEAGLDRDLLAAQRAELVPCDEAFWATAPGDRPQDIQDRQRAIYLMGQARCTSDWALICDADEFVIDRMPVPEFLGALPDDVSSVAIAPVEAVWGPGEDINAAFGSTWFRRPDIASSRLEKRLQLRSLWLYGPLGILFRSGILSHAVGKQFIRTRAHFDVIDLHFSTVDGKRLTRRAVDIDPALAQVELAHFDAISFERWHAKSLRRVLHDTRTAMMRRSGRRRLQLRIFDLLRRFGKAGPRWFYRRLYTLTPRQTRLLMQRDMAFQMHLFEDQAPGAAGQSARSRA